MKRGHIEGAVTLVIVALISWPVALIVLVLGLIRRYLVPAGRWLLWKLRITLLGFLL